MIFAIDRSNLQRISVVVLETAPFSINLLSTLEGRTVRCVFPPHHDWTQSANCFMHNLHLFIFNKSLLLKYVVHFVQLRCISDNLDVSDTNLDKDHLIKKYMPRNSAVALLLLGHVS